VFIDACCTIGCDGDVDVSADALLKEMDVAGVDKAVIHPADRCYAWENEYGNRVVTSEAKKHPDRLIPAVTVNPWRPDAWDVLRAGIDAGGRMLTFSPGVQGFVLSVCKLEPIREALAALSLNVPVFVHTGHHSNATPCQLAMLARRLGNLNFIMGHCGATDYATDAVPACKYSDNIYLESSFSRPPGFVKRPGEIGADRCIMGSGYPYNQFEFEWSEMRRLLPSEYHEAVLGGNLSRLLGGPNDC